MVLGTKMKSKMHGKGKTPYIKRTVFYFQGLILSLPPTKGNVKNSQKAIYMVKTVTL